MKKIPLILALCSLAGCGGNNGSDSLADASGNSASMLATTMVLTPAMPTAAATAAANSGQFLMDAYRDGLAEIQLSQLALQRAANEDVRRFAQRMIDHHTRLNAELSQLAQSRNKVLPTALTADQTAQAERLGSLTGDAFDRAYMALNAEVHEADVSAAKLQAELGSDASIKQLADASLPLLELHLAAAEEVLNLLDPSAFLAAAYRDGLAEIQLSQLALQRAEHTEVRQFAQRMIDDHTDANRRIAALAQQKGVSLPAAPSPSQQAAAQQLAEFAGVDFDKAYIDKNVVQHVKDVRQARQQSQQGRDADVQNLAQEALPTLAVHLAAALAIDRRTEPSFLYRAYQDGKAEIQFGHLALIQGANEQVKTFGQQMVSDHTSVNNQLLQLAQQRGMALPDEMSPTQLVAFVDLLQRTGVNFDRRYMELNVRVHEDDIAELTEQAQSANDAALSAWAQNALPLLNAHLSRARQVQQVLNTQPEP